MKRLVEKCEIFLMILLISGCSITVGTHSSRRPAKQTREQVRRQEKTGATHIVKPGENLYRISVYYYDSPSTEEAKKGVERIRNANRLESEQLSVGQKILVPGTKKKQPDRPLLPPGSGDPTTSRTASGRQPPSGELPAPERPPAGETPSIVKDTMFVWPVIGKIICRYGELGNQGMDILARPEADVVASRDGEVSFSGTTAKYGETLIIQHDNNYLTVYGHDFMPSVKKGGKVKKGEAIGKMKSGTQKQRYLHFELRLGAEPRNPMTYLPPIEVIGTAE